MAHRGRVTTSATNDASSGRGCGARDLFAIGPSKGGLAEARAQAKAGKLHECSEPYTHPALFAVVQVHGLAGSAEAWWNIRKVILKT